MIKIDLITGFLGAGKTTFIKKYADYLIRSGQNIGILENDYGAVNVDMMLLQDLLGEHCELEMIAGGCCKDCHRRRFKSKLIAMGMCGYDRVLIEPSGIYDVDEFFDVLHEDPLDRWYQIDNVIAIVDASLEENLSKEAEYVLASEAADAGRIVMSKTQNASPEAIAGTIAHLNRAMETVRCARRFRKEEILTGNWDSFTDETFRDLLHCGFSNESFCKLGSGEGFQSVCMMNLNLTKEALTDAVKDVFSDPQSGRVFRIKGFLKDEKGGWLQLNATKDEVSLTPIRTGQEVLIVIGENLDEAGIRRRFGG